jgi:hypothetical protein
LIKIEAENECFGFRRRINFSDLGSSLWRRLKAAAMLEKEKERWKLMVHDEAKTARQGRLLRGRKLRRRRKCEDNNFKGCFPASFSLGSHPAAWTS